MTLDSKALPIANVDVTKAVLGNTNEYQVIANVILPRPKVDPWAPTETRKNHHARLEVCQCKGLSSTKEKTYPHTHSEAQLLTILIMVPVSAPFPIKLIGKDFCTLCAILTIPAAVNPLGPTETNIPGRKVAGGSF